MESELLKDILSLIPPLTFASHKGSFGKIGIVGGCKEYTGGPYFAALSALKVGCDLAHVICTSEAAVAIKSYSPELIVHPILDSQTVQDQFLELLPRLHSIVIGPGLGCEIKTLEATGRLIDAVKAADVPLVLDADALLLVRAHPDIIYGYKKAILTPNKNEFKRLYESICKQSLKEETTEHDVQHLSNALGNVTIVHKGLQDFISDGMNTVVCREFGSPRRCGGQGDILAGTIGVFSYWTHKFNDTTDLMKLSNNSTIIAALAACLLTKKCSYSAFQKFRRSTLTTDMIAEIRVAFSSLFPVD